MKKKRIVLFSGSRSEFFLQKPIIHELKKLKSIELKILISGSHLDKKFTNDLEKELKHLKVDYITQTIPKNDLDLFSNGVVIGKAISRITNQLQKLNPDAVIIYGDRYESFAAMIAASQSGIFTFHIEGGDITNGTTFDDNVRHAMSKLANFHFVTNENAQKVLMQMGEDKQLIQIVGLPINDFIYKNIYTNEQDLIDLYQLNQDSEIIIFTLHPEPLIKTKQ